MKISKIACVAILGISLSTTSLFAKISNENEAFTKAFTNQHDRDKEYKAVSEALTELKKIGYDKLATWDDTKKADESADNGIHKKIFDTLKKIGEQIKDKKTELPKITAKDGNKEISIEVKQTDNDAVLRLTVKNIANVDGYDDTNVDLDNSFKLKKNEFSNLFSAANKTLWKNLITEFENKHKELHDKRVKDAALAFAKSNIGDDDKMDAYVKYQDKLTSALEKEIADKQAAGQSAQDEINKLNEFYKAATDKKLIDDSIKNYETKLDENPKKIKKAQEELPELQKAKNEKDQEFTNALKELKNGANKDKVTPETTAKDVIEQENALGLIKNTLDSLTSPGITGVRGATIEALKDAIKNGVPVKSDGQIFKTAKEFEDFAKSNPNKDFKTEATAAKTAVEQAKQALATVKEKAVASEAAAKSLTDKEKEITQAEEEMVQAKQNINLASKARAKAISRSASFNTELSELFSSFSSLALENQTVQDIMSNADTEDLIQGIQELHSTLDESSKT
ncbi:MAG: hypothetical protein ACTTJC_05865, partial [Campylobacter sp.]